jgi:hypothetical protein
MCGACRLGSLWLGSIWAHVQPGTWDHHTCSAGAGAGYYISATSARLENMGTDYCNACEGHILMFCSCTAGLTSQLMWAMGRSAAMHQPLQQLRLFPAMGMARVLTTNTLL